MMSTIIQALIVFSLVVVLGPYHTHTLDDTYETIAYVEKSNEDPVKQRAFEILSNKCNVCHSRRNRRRVFSHENMNPWANDVYKQVFVKKRMPKGKNSKLTSEAYQDLLTWIASTKNTSNGNQL